MPVRDLLSDVVPGVTAATVALATGLACDASFDRTGGTAGAVTFASGLLAATITVRVAFPRAWMDLKVLVQRVLAPRRDRKTARGIANSSAVAET
jgi:hypothetical protein